eukprot:987395-Pleurochrysis_carterae.AAC.6
MATVSSCAPQKACVRNSCEEGTKKVNGMRASISLCGEGICEEQGSMKMVKKRIAGPGSCKQVVEKEKRAREKCEHGSMRACELASLREGESGIQTVRERGGKR